MKAQNFLQINDSVILNIEKIIRTALESLSVLQPQQALSCSPVPGGDTHTAYRASTSQAHYFLKLSHEPPQSSLESMADVLASEHESLCTIDALFPNVYLPIVGFYRTEAWAALVMPYQNLSALTANNAHVLGGLLAKQHRITHSQFGWEMDNFIGSTPQLNQWQSEWPLFYAEQRLRPQLVLAMQQGASEELMTTGLALIDALPQFFVDYQPMPSLLHGDLWGGNAAACVPDAMTASNLAEACLFDPAPYFGDRETDLAMTELFGGFPETFYAAYQTAYPLDTGYQQRKPLYQLYHILNHYNLFGGHYQQQALTVMQGLLRVV